MACLKYFGKKNKSIYNKIELDTCSILLKIVPWRTILSLYIKIFEFRVKMRGFILNMIMVFRDLLTVTGTAFLQWRKFQKEIL